MQAYPVVLLRNVYSPAEAAAQGGRGFLDELELEIREAANSFGIVHNSLAPPSSYYAGAVAVTFNEARRIRLIDPAMCSM